MGQRQRRGGRYPGSSRARPPRAVVAAAAWESHPPVRTNILTCAPTRGLATLCRQHFVCHAWANRCTVCPYDMQVITSTDLRACALNPGPLPPPVHPTAVRSFYNMSSLLHKVGTLLVRAEENLCCGFRTVPLRSPAARHPPRSLAAGLHVGVKLRRAQAGRAGRLVGADQPAA
eukprot:SAG11_NODE_2409_length_3396_cov_1.523506_2_plen_174_part_00